MDEALKTNRLRGDIFFEKYLTGRVIDIGAGNDLVIPTAERFDLEDGDANFITKYRDQNSYDSVHSSHCLEHMFEPENALKEWWALVKPGGYLILVVPDEDLYEQGIWPSIFNLDHKNTFRFAGDASWSPVSYNIQDLVCSLPNAQIISSDVHDQGYRYELKKDPKMKYSRPPFVLRALKLLLNKSLLFKYENILFKYYGWPVDQTMRGAMAQIQIVAKKII